MIYSRQKKAGERGYTSVNRARGAARGTGTLFETLGLDGDAALNIIECRGKITVRVINYHGTEALKVYGIE